MKVRANLVLMATAILLPMAIFSAVALATLLSSERESGHRSVRETARAVSLAIERDLTNAESALRVLSNSEALGRGDISAFYAKALIARTSEYAWIVLCDKDGLQLVNTKHPYGRLLPKRANLVHIQEVLRTGHTRVSEVYIGAVVQRHITTVDVPVHPGVGGPYVLAQVFLPEYFKHVFADKVVPDGWSVTVFDQRGISVTSNRLEGNLVGIQATAKLRDAMSAASAGDLRHIDLQGNEIFDVFIRSPISGWTVVVGVPAKELDAPALSAVGVASFGLIAALIVGVGLAYWRGRSLSASIAQAANVASMLGRDAVAPAAKLGIDELDHLHEALRKAHANLVAEKDARLLAEVDRAKLYASEQVARSIAEAQNKAKDDFLAMLSHELRNPLNAIVGALAAVRYRRGEPAVVRHAHEVVERQAGHLGHIVDDLLEVSRVVSGKIRLHRRPLDLAAAARHAIKTLDVAGRTQLHQVELFLEEAWVDADATRVDQIITNMLVNAFKYTPEGGTVTIQVQPVGDEAVLTVRDTGIGIAADLMPYIFDVFTQGQPSLDRAQGGLGIGLSLVRKLIELHGATVSAQSDGPGKGSVFTAHFVRIAAPPLAARVAIHNEAATAEAPRMLHILVVDDHVDSRVTCCELLQAVGHETLEAGDGLVAVRIAKDEMPDLAIVDIGLTGISGIEVARRLRADPVARKILLIALSGYGQEQDREQAMAAGFDAYLVKPASPDHLFETIDRLTRPLFSDPRP